jgi:hypothetical protein
MEPAAGLGCLVSNNVPYLKLGNLVVHERANLEHVRVLPYIVLRGCEQRYACH